MAWRSLILTAVMPWLTTSTSVSSTAPSDAWSALNASVNGRLERDVPLALPCFTIYNGMPHTADEALCAVIRANYTDPKFRIQAAGGYMNGQDEGCMSEPADQCVLDGSVSPAALPSANSSCNQGSVPLYYIQVQGASDAAKAFNFARRYNVPLSIKNSGHDYTTRNSQKGSLAMWTHGLQDMSHHVSFVPEGCTGDEHTYAAVMTLGAGVTADMATTFATAHNATILVPASSTVGISGGFIQGGGRGVLSPVYGLAIDRVVQYRVVTPDGVLRTANACQNQDLFWALRGGGGGTFGLVLESTSRVEPAPMPIAVAHMKLPAGNLTAGMAIEWVGHVADLSLAWAKQGWGGHIAASYMTYMNPVPRFANLSDGGAYAAESMRAASDYVTSLGGTTVVEVLPSWAEVWEKYSKPEERPSGAWPIFGGRLMPKRLFETGEMKDGIKNFLRQAQQYGFNPLNTYIPADLPSTLEGSTSRDGYDTNTSTNPGFHDALWNVASGLAIPSHSSYAVRLETAVNATKILRLAQNLAGPDSAAYVLESSPFTDDWKEAWWGPNYPRLLEIKKKYDPDMLLKCWKCVGFEDSDAESPIYKCQGKLQSDINRAMS
jgi:FAD/FMN-containing dehydrogenase